MTNRLRLGATLALLLLAAVSCSHEPDPGPPVALRTEALFENGDFEDDALNASPTKWVVTPYLNNRVDLQKPQTFEGLSLDAGGGLVATRVVGAASPESLSDPVATALKYPKFGTRTAVINYAPPTAGGASQNVNGLRQQMAVTQADVDPDDQKIHIRFVIAAVLQNPTHDLNEQPYYFVQVRNVTRATLLYQDFQVSNQPGVPWRVASALNEVLFTDWQLVDVAPDASALAVGDVVQTEVIAAGCSRGGHYGRVYVDSFGAVLKGLFTSASAAQSTETDKDLTYTVNYKNGAVAAASGAVVEFVTPPQTTYKSTTATGCSEPTVGAAGTLSCPIGSIAAGAKGSFQVTVHVNPDAAGKITQGNYLIRASGISALLGTHVVTDIPNPDLVANVSSGLAVVGWGQPITYTIRITNSGKRAATGVSVSDMIPAELTGVTWQCAPSAGASCTHDGTGNIADLSAVLPIDATITYTLRGTLVSGTGSGQTTHRVTATVTAGASGVTPISETVTETLDIRTLRAATLTKSAAGIVTSSPTGLVCRAGCTSQTSNFILDNTVRFTAAAPSGGRFTGWGGDCASRGTMTTCDLMMSANHSLSAQFAPPTLSIASGSPQKADINTAYGAPLVVLVVDPDGTPVQGVPVSFSAPNNSASGVLDASSRVTDVAGHAQVNVVANANPGTFVVAARVSGAVSTAAFTLSNIGPPAAVRVISGNTQSVPVHATSSTPLVVEVTDAAGQPLPDVSVTFTAPDSGASASLTATTVSTSGTAASVTTVTNSVGRAGVIVTGSDRSGAYPITISAGNLPGVSFTLTNTASTPVAITAALSSTPQSARVTTDFVNPLRVRVLDTYGNPVPDVDIVWSAPTSDPTAKLSSTLARTDANGEASVRATALKQSGSYNVTAKLRDKPGSTTFALTNTAGDPLRVAITDGTDQKGVATQDFEQPLTVEVRDAQGNAVTGSKVHVEVMGDAANATPSAADITTDADGKATVDLAANDIPGVFTVTFSLTGAATPVSTEMTIEPIATQATLAATPTELTLGGEVLLTATLTSAHGTPTGLVQFIVDTRSIGEVELSAGEASLQFHPELEGMREVTVHYTAQGPFGESESEVTTVSIIGPPTGVADGGMLWGNDGGTIARPRSGSKPDSRGWRIAGGGCAVARRADSTSQPALWLLGLGLFFAARRRRQRRR